MISMNIAFYSAATGMIAQQGGMNVTANNIANVNTVGYKELFNYLDGQWDLPAAVARIAKNTRVYAKKQLTWLKRDASVIWLDPHADNIADAVLCHAGVIAG